MKILKENLGDGGYLKVRLSKYPNHKRYHVSVYKENRMIENKSFNKRKNAERNYNKILEEF